VFAGYGFVWVAAWIDATGPLAERVQRLRVPDRTQIGTLVLLFVLVASLGIVQVPVKTSQVTITDNTYHTSQFLAEHSADRGQEYPDNYVLSEGAEPSLQLLRQRRVPELRPRAVELRPVHPESEPRRVLRPVRGPRRLRRPRDGTVGQRPGNDVPSS